MLWPWFPDSLTDDLWLVIPNPHVVHVGELCLVDSYCMIVMTDADSIRWLIVTHMLTHEIWWLIDCLPSGLNCLYINQTILPSWAFFTFHLCQWSMAQKISVYIWLSLKWHCWKAVLFLSLFQFIHNMVPGWLRLVPAKGLKHHSLVQASIRVNKNNLNWQKRAFGGCKLTPASCCTSSSEIMCVSNSLTGGTRSRFIGGELGL